ncbi:MAG: hypothetical protein IPO93_02740 [Actinobacteria bacterium]|nr:hypothetical protein [Actinomycetota bacterium]
MTRTADPFDPNTNVSGDSWGDFIPAFAESDRLPTTTGAGAAILADGCNVPPSIGALSARLEHLATGMPQTSPDVRAHHLTAPTPDQYWCSCSSMP